MSGITRSVTLPRRLAIGERARAHLPSTIQFSFKAVRRCFRPCVWTLLLSIVTGEPICKPGLLKSPLAKRAPWQWWAFERWSMSVACWSEKSDRCCADPPGSVAVGSAWLGCPASEQRWRLSSESQRGRRRIAGARTGRAMGGAAVVAAIDLRIDVGDRCHSSPRAGAAWASASPSDGLALGGSSRGCRNAGGRHLVHGRRFRGTLAAVASQQWSTSPIRSGPAAIWSEAAAGGR